MGTDQPFLAADRIATDIIDPESDYMMPKQASLSN
jgi:hypothetical protein